MRTPDRNTPETRMDMRKWLVIIFSGIFPLNYYCRTMDPFD